MVRPSRSSRLRTVSVLPPPLRNFGKLNTTEKPTRSAMRKSAATVMATATWNAVMRTSPSVRFTLDLSAGLGRVGYFVGDQAAANLFHRYSLSLVPFLPVRGRLVGLAESWERPATKLLGAHRGNVDIQEPAGDRLHRFVRHLGLMLG